MKILTRPERIRAAITEILGEAKGERVIAVAYVGADALSFLPAPAGVTVYCWPQAGGTNPYGVEALVDAGAKVRFVKRLHAKVYWSSSRGALVGSANLTANALGEQALQEAAVWVPAGAFDMRSFTRSLKVEPDFSGVLQQLHEAHVRFQLRNPPRRRLGGPRPQLPSFPEWFSREGRADWRLGWYDEEADAPKDAVKGYEEETGTREFAAFMGTKSPHNFKIGVFTLNFRVREVANRVKLSAFGWWSPDTKVQSSQKGWKDYPYIWFARTLIPAGTRPPFNAQDRRFRAAFQETINEMGGLKWLERGPLKPTKRFFDLLNRHYLETQAD
jgi:hypothetical protein